MPRYSRPRRPPASPERFVMEFLKISNRGMLNRMFLELIGLTTKRARMNDRKIIGNKGSGTKLAAVAGLRLGLDTAIASTDDAGRYLLTFDVEESTVDGTPIRRIFFKYRSEDGTFFRSPSNMVLEAFQDWDKPIGADGKTAFKVVREFVCNAMDADGGRVNFDMVDEPDLVEAGRTAVFLRCTDEIQELLRDRERYFKFLSTSSKPLFAEPAIGDIYPKSEAKKTRLYVLGVLVECSAYDWQRSVFDYSVGKKSLVSEERIITNYWDYVSEVGKLLGSLTDLDLAAEILASVAAGKAKFEESALGRLAQAATASAETWRKVAHGLFGKNLAVASANADINKDAGQVHGCTIIGENSPDLRGFFPKIGIPTAEDIVNAAPKYEMLRFADLDADSRRRFYEAFAFFARHFPKRAALPIAIYFPLSEALKRMAGFAGADDRKFKEIWMAAKSRTELPSVLDMLKTLIHESRHCAAEAGDYDRKFVNLADDDMAMIIIRESGLRILGSGEVVPAYGNPARIRPNLVGPTASAKVEKVVDDPLLEKEWADLFKKP